MDVTNQIMTHLLVISVEKVIVMICGPCALPSPSDEVIVAETVGSILKSTGKGFVVWMKDKQIAVEPDVLLQMIIGEKSSIVNAQPQMSYPGLRPTKAAYVAASVPTGRQCVKKTSGCHATRPPPQETLNDPLRHGHNVCQSQQTMLNQPTGTSSSTEDVPTKEFVMLQTRLFSGRISYQRAHVETLHPVFKVPDYIEKRLYQKHLNTPEAIVKIILDTESGVLRWSVVPTSKATGDEKSLHLAENKTVMLKTRLRYGQISMEESDLEFIYPQWEIPRIIIERLKREFWKTPDSELSVFSDGNGNLRCEVLTGQKLGVLDKAFNKVKKSLKNAFA